FTCTAGDIQRLINAWKTLAMRTEALQIAFTTAAAYSATVIGLRKDDCTPVFVQVSLSSAKIRAQREPDLSADSARDFARTLATLLFRATVPLWVVTTLGEDVGTPAMLLSMHNAPYDGHAYRLLLHDVLRVQNCQHVALRLQLTSAVSRAFFLEDPLSLWEQILAQFADGYAEPFAALPMIATLPVAVSVDFSSSARHSFVAMVERSSTSKSSPFLGSQRAIIVLDFILPLPS
ncbi:hypothetical protein FB107DRAFT_252293, partial [Schizophyllum commune]